MMNRKTIESNRLRFPVLRVAALSICLGGTLATSTAALAQDMCQQPTQPEALDGSAASMEAMLAGQKAVKAFQASNMEYMQCLEAKSATAEADAKNLQDGDAQALARADYAKSIDAYNAAVSAEEEVAEAFNVALRAYKAANK
ncbi:MAG: hypothetical protein AB8B76_09925 [Congregibacter sp.]